MTLLQLTGHYAPKLTVQYIYLSVYFYTKIIKVHKSTLSYAHTYMYLHITQCTKTTNGIKDYIHMHTKVTFYSRHHRDKKSVSNRDLSYFMSQSKHSTHLEQHKLSLRIS